MSDLMMSTLKPSLSFTEMDFAELNESAIENSSLGFMFGMPFSDNFPSFSPAEFPKPAFEPETTKKRKLEAAMAGDQKLKRRKQCFKGSVVRSSLPKDGEKQKGVVHVRARRGQATDSHSLAERVRRERINEKMRCLQDLVPGCCKTMGMASMLDEIINYVQSLQNQVEFLSMKLSAASTFYDFDLDVESMPIPIPKQMRNGESEAGDAERDQVYGDLIGFSSALPF